MSGPTMNSNRFGENRARRSTLSDSPPPRSMIARVCVTLQRRASTRPAVEFLRERI